MEQETGSQARAAGERAGTRPCGRHRGSRVLGERSWLEGQWWYPAPRCAGSVFWGRRNRVPQSGGEAPGAVLPALEAARAGAGVAARLPGAWGLLLALAAASGAASARAHPRHTAIFLTGARVGLGEGRPQPRHDFVVTNYPAPTLAPSMVHAEALGPGLQRLCVCGHSSTRSSRPVNTAQRKHSQRGHSRRLSQQPVSCESRVVALSNSAHSWGPSRESGASAPAPVCGAPPGERALPPPHAAASQRGPHWHHVSCLPRKWFFTWGSWTSRSTGTCQNAAVFWSILECSRCPTLTC